VLLRVREALSTVFAELRLRGPKALRETALLVADRGEDLAGWSRAAWARLRGRAGSGYTRVLLRRAERRSRKRG
jgi:hypothetical protein